MAKRKMKKDKNGHSVLSLNYDALKKRYYEKHGEILTHDKLANESCRVRMTLEKYKKELPPPVTFIANLMKEFGMSFEEITQQAYE